MKDYEGVYIEDYAKFEEIQVQPPVTTIALHTIYLGEGGRSAKRCAMPLVSDV